MNSATTWYELFAILGLVTYLCAPAIKRLFDPEIQRARRRMMGRRAARVEAREEKTQTKAAAHELGDEPSRAFAGGTSRAEELRIALTRSSANALLATLQAGVGGAPKSAGTIDPKLVEVLRPGRRTITIEVDDAPVSLANESGDDAGATSQQLFVVRSAATGEVRVSSPWEYMSDPGSGRREPAPATIWSAHSGFLGRRASTPPPIPRAGAAKATVANEIRWTPKRASRRP
jgi:hypothetical protein